MSLDSGYWKDSINEREKMAKKQKKSGLPETLFVQFYDGSTDVDFTTEDQDALDRNQPCGKYQLVDSHVPQDRFDPIFK